MLNSPQQSFEPEALLNQTLNSILSHDEAQKSSSDPGRLIAEIMVLLNAGLAKHLQVEIQDLLTQLMLLSGQRKEGYVKHPTEVVLQAFKELGKPLAEPDTSGKAKLTVDEGNFILDVSAAATLSSWWACPRVGGNQQDPTENIGGTLQFFVALPVECEGSAYSAQLICHSNVKDALRRGVWNLSTIHSNDGRTWTRQKFSAKCNPFDTLSHIFSFTFENPRTFGPRDPLFNNRLLNTREWRSKWPDDDTYSPLKSLLEESGKNKARIGSARLGLLECTLAEDVLPSSITVNGNLFPAKLMNYSLDTQIKRNKLFECNGSSYLVRAVISPPAQDSPLDLIREAPDFYRLPSRPVTVQDWEELTKRCDPRIEMAFVREGYCSENGRFGKGVHVTFIPKRMFSGQSTEAVPDEDDELVAFLADLEKEIEEAGKSVRRCLNAVRPMGLLFEIWLPRFHPCKIHAIRECFPGKQDDQMKIVQNLHSMCRYGRTAAAIPFVEHFGHGFKRNVCFQISLREYAQRNFFAKDLLLAPFLLRSATVAVDQSAVSSEQWDGFPFAHAIEIVPEPNADNQRASEPAWSFPLVTRVVAGVQDEARISLG